MGRPYRVTIPHTSRSLHQLRIRVTFVLFVCALLLQQHQYYSYREALSAKYSPTEFPLHFTKELAQPWMLDEESLHFQDRLIANGDAWETLGEGWEGKTFVYQDSVIKTFTPGRSPFRNCAPGTADEKWPTEIPASLLFGGYGHNATSSDDGFLPVKAYFTVKTSTSPTQWHLVTPLLESGSLTNLAARNRKEAVHYQDIDARYRSTFERLLQSLHKLHEAGYCHDDVKPSNIFVADDGHWLLGDLGNLRHVSHPYHTSLLWKDNKQEAHCRANDVMRALKSYLSFVRESAVDADVFDLEFLEGNKPLSRLFWSTAANASTMSAAELLDRLAIEHLTRDMVDDTLFVPNFSHTLMGIFSRRGGYHHAVDRVLQMSMSEKMAKRWTMTWLFGIPVTTVCGV